MKSDDAGNPFEPGDALKNDNFSKWWLTFFLIGLVLVIVIAAIFWIGVNHHVTQWRPS